jgi:hypothetical protein
LEPFANKPQITENINSINQSHIKGATIPTKNLLLIKPIVAITVFKRNLKEEKGGKDKHKNEL